jgi:hypothetical protein
MRDYCRITGRITTWWQAVSGRSGIEILLPMLVLISPYLIELSYQPLTITETEKKGGQRFMYIIISMGTLRKTRFLEFLLITVGFTIPIRTTDTAFSFREYRLKSVFENHANLSASFLYEHSSLSRALDNRDFAYDKPSESVGELQEHSGSPMIHRSTDTGFRWIMIKLWLTDTC